MARFVVSAIVGIAVGIVGGPAAGFQAFALTYGFTGFLDPNQQVSGPRIDDLKGTTAEYGTAIAHVYGHPRLAGAIVWCSDKREIATTEEAGGKGGPSTDVTTYTYEIDVRILLTANPIGGIRRVWSNGKVIWSIADDADEETIEASLNTNAWRRITVYGGGPTQMPDPTEEAALGIENCPAYRGRGSVFIEGLNLGGSGFLPNLTFEIATSGGTFEPVVFDYTGADQTWLCPEGVTAVQVRALGGGGGGGNVAGVPGSGGFGAGAGYVRGIVSVTPGELYTVIVGGGGIAPIGVGGSGGYGGGGDGGGSGSIPAGTYRAGGGGGGRSALAYSGLDLITAAGGGGGGAANPGISGGAGGGEEGEGVGGESGGGGTQIGGGAPGSPTLGSNGDAGEAGSLEEGGDGGSSPSPVDPANCAGGGGGGGYYGGGGGGASNLQGGGGGGGSSFGDYTEAGDGTDPGGQDDAYFSEELGHGGGGDGQPGRLVILPAATASLECVPLADVLEDLCVRSGLESSYLDFSSCEGQEVCALAVSQVTSARAVMELLGSAYLQEFVESDMLKTVARGGAALDPIPYEAMGASLSESPEPLPLRRLNDVELPAQVAITYVNLLNDYQKGTEYSDRLLGVATGVSTSELALGLTPQEAKRIADVRLTDAVASIIQAGPVGLLKEYAHLEPCDVVPLIGHDGSTYRVRILKLTVDQGVHTVECVLDDATVINSAALTDEDYVSSSIVRALAETTLELLDIPILRDADNDAGIYAAVTRSTLEGDWPGAALFRGVDEAAWSEVARYTDRTFIGTTTTPLGAWSGLHGFDEVNTVTVSGIGTLQSYTRSAILNGTASAYLIGDEILYARNASTLSEGVYLLSGLLRARRGTEVEALAGHSSGERAVLLQNSGLRRVAFEQGQLGAEFDFRAVTLGTTIAAADTESITPMGVGLRPFSPVHLRAEDNGDGTFDVSWTRRTRLRTRFTGAAGIYAPLGEASESYVVRVYDGSDVLQSTQTVSTDSATVTAAAGYTVNVYQVGAVAGRETEKVL